MVLLIVLYGALALTRELCAVKYYGSVYAGRALSASALGLSIGLLDSLALVVVFEKIVSGWGMRAIIPLAVYEVCGAAGTYIGVAKRNK